MVQVSDLIRKKLDDNDTFLVFAPPKTNEFKTVGLDLLRYLVNEKKSPVVYVCIDKPHSSIKRELDKEEINSKMIVFIDAVTPMGGAKPNDDKCVYIMSPENLTDISIALSQAIGSLSGNKTFIIVDSLSTLLVYNNIQTVLKFVHIINAKIKQCGAKGIAMSAKKGTDDEFINQVFQFFDDSIGISGEG